MPARFLKWFGVTVVGAIGALWAASLGLKNDDDKGLMWLVNFGCKANTISFDTSKKVKTFRATSAVFGYGETIAWAAQTMRDGDLITSCDDSRFDRIPLNEWFFTSMSRDIEHRPDANSVFGFCGFGIAFFYYKEIE